jgi:hypothetical protein
MTHQDGRMPDCRGMAGNRSRSCRRAVVA